MAVLIEVQDLARTFSTGRVLTEALKAVNLTIDDGESVAIVGPSGSGKSTFLSLLGLLDIPTAGTYLLRGEPITQLTQRQQEIIRNQHLGWVFQNFSLIADLNALDNVVLPLRYNKQVKSTDYEQKGRDALQKVGLGDKLHHFPAELSGGQQQRVAIARAIVGQPHLILADEPTGNLDSKTGQSIIELLMSLNQEGATLLLVTHDESIAKRCQRQIFFKDGAIQHDQKQPAL